MHNGDTHYIPSFVACYRFNVIDIFLLVNASIQHSMYTQADMSMRTIIQSNERGVRRIVLITLTIFHRLYICARANMYQFSVLQCYKHEHNNILISSFLSISEE